MIIPFKGLYRSESPIIADIQMENVYINKPQTSGTQTEASIFNTPGIVSQLTTGSTLDDLNRGAHVMDGVLYMVNGERFLEITRTINDFNEEVFSIRLIGQDVTGSGRVSMADNGTQLMVLVPGGDGYIYDKTTPNAFNPISDPDFKANGNPQQVVFIDSFFVCTTDSKKFIKSASNDGKSWNALDFGSAEADPDDIVAPIVFKNQLYIAGSEIFEVFQNLGTGGFPFQRINGYIINKGVFAPFSLVKTSSSFMFIGGGVNESAAIWELAGTEARKVSNTAIDTELQKYSPDELKEAFGFSYAQEGAYFVGFSFPDRTFVYDTVSQEWHERTSQVEIDGVTQQIRWRVNSLATAYGRVWVGDSQDGRIGTLDVNELKEYNNPIIRTFSVPAIQANGEAVTTSELELQFETGLSDEGQDCQVRMDYSDDGKTWSYEDFKSLGKIGEYSRRVIWSRLGRTPFFRIYRFQISDPIRIAAGKLIARVKASARGR